MPARRTRARTLIERQNEESTFHDKKYVDDENYPRHYKLNPTYPIYQRMLRMAGDIHSKHVLEYGCGEGWITQDLARAGAYVSAFDISAEAVRHTREILTSDGVADHCDIRKMGAEQLEYPDQSFDIVIGFAILHHLDIHLAIPELHRVLRPGGFAFFAEPLGNNSLINLYRRLTPQYRTKDEEPLDLETLAPLFSRFRESTHRNFYVTALAAIALGYLPFFGRAMYSILNKPLMALDDTLLDRFPVFNKLAWYTIVTLKK